MLNILLTGCTSGVGFEVLKILCYSGHKVVGIGRSRDFDWQHPNFQYVMMDISKEWSYNQFDYRLNNIHKLSDIEFDCIIQNAGITKRAYLEDHSHDEIQDIINVNLVNPIHIHKYVDKPNKDQLFINVLSGSAVHDFRLLPIYATAKAGLLKFTKQMLMDYKDQNREVSKVFYNLLPGPIDTKLCPEHYKTKGEVKVLTPVEVASKIDEAISKYYGKETQVIEEFI
jgi:short-subunit dehydrogenase